MPSIAYVAQLFYSKRDRAGNQYWYVTVTRTSDCQTITEHCSGGESNILIALRKLSEHAQYTYSSTQLSIPDFNQRTKDMIHLGCDPFDVLNDHFNTYPEEEETCDANNDRATLGEEAVCNSPDSGCSVYTCMSDLLANISHFCDRVGVDFLELCEAAERSKQGDREEGLFVPWDSLRFPDKGDTYPWRDEN